MSPADYMKCYHKLQVPVAADDKVARWAQVELSRYILVVKQDKATGALTWDGHVGTTLLPPGTYTVAARAIDAAGNFSPSSVRKIEVTR